MRGFSVIVATDDAGGIANEKGIPWDLPEDRVFFREKTEKCKRGKINAVIMGSKTYLSLPPRARPLKNRVNIILSSSLVLEENSNIKIKKSLNDALEYAWNCVNIDKIFVIGGERPYAEALEHDWCEKIYISRVRGSYDCKKFFPKISDDFDLEKSYLHHEKFDVEKYRKIIPSHDEYQYLRLVKNIITNGNVKGDRTGTGVRSSFGHQARYNLRKSFPLLTTKRVFWRGVVEELLWMIKGHTDSKLLAERGVHIWDGNGSREFLDKNGFVDREEGDLGPVYGFQWRHYGCEYVDSKKNYDGMGIDQLYECIDKIKNNPNDRFFFSTFISPKKN